MLLSTKKPTHFDTKINARISIKSIRYGNGIIGVGDPVEKIIQKFLRMLHTACEERGINNVYLSCYDEIFVYSSYIGKCFHLECFCEYYTVEALKSCISQTMDEISELAFIIFSTSCNLFCTPESISSSEIWEYTYDAEV